LAILKKRKKELELCCSRLRLSFSPPFYITAALTACLTGALTSEKAKKVTATFNKQKLNAPDAAGIGRPAKYGLSQEEYYTA